MSNDDSEFTLQFDAEEAKRARAVAADVDRLADSFDHLAAAAKRVPAKTTLPGAGSSQKSIEEASKWAKVWERVAASDSIKSRRAPGGAASVAERMRSSFTGLAPASRVAAQALRAFGVSGAPLRKVTIDAAKTEIALNRLFRMKGGGLKGSASVIGALWQRMGAPEGSGFGSGLRQKASDTIMGGLGTVAGGIGTAVTMGAVAVGGGLVAGAAALATSMTTATAKAEQLKLALSTVAKDSTVDWWAKSEEYARKFGGDVNVIAANLMQMKASQFGDAMTQDLFLRTQDMKALGTTEEAVGRMLLAIRQIKAAGRLQGDELNQLGEAGLDASFVYDVLGKKLGKTNAELVKMKEAGQLTSDIVLPAISEAIGVKTGGKPAGEVGAAAAQKTLIGSWERLKGSFSVTAIEALGTDALSPLRDGVNKFTDWLNGAGGKAAAGSFGSMLGKMFEYAPVVVDKVVWLFDTALPKAWDVATTAWEAFSAAFSSNTANTAVWSAVSDTFTDLAGPNGDGAVDKLTKFATQAGYAASAVATLVGGLAFFVEGAVYAADALSNLSLGEILGGVLAFSAGPIVGSAFVLGDLLVRSIGDGIRSGASYVIDALVGVVHSAIASVGGFFTSIPFIGRWFSGLGGAASEGMAQGIDTGSSGVYDSAYAMGDAATGGVVDSTDTHSPSRRMHELGMFGGEGYSGGIDAAIPWAQDSGAGLGEAAVGGAERSSIDFGSAAQIRNAGAGLVTASTGQSAASAPMIQASFNITLPAGTSPEQAQQLGSAMVKGAEPELAAMLRRLNYSGT